MDVAPEKDIGAFLKKSFVRLDESWREMTREDFGRVTLAEILTGANRLIFQFEIAGTVWYAATHSDDAKRLRIKHPTSKIVSIASIIGLFTPESESVKMDREDLGSMFELISVFPGRYVDLR